MTLGPVNKIYKKKKTRPHQKNLTMTSCQQIVTPLSFLNLLAIWRNPKFVFWMYKLQNLHFL